MKEWAQAAGEPASSHSAATGFAGSTLVVEADDPGWTQELSLRKTELLDRLAARLGEGVVKDLRIVLRRG